MRGSRAGLPMQLWEGAALLAEERSAVKEYIQRNARSVPANARDNSQPPERVFPAT